MMAGVVFALHGRSLPYGLFLDDYAHFQQLREADWSIASLTAACRLELDGGVADIWWFHDFTLRFFRPVSFGLMKLTYTLCGWNPLPMHVASLLWHTGVSVLLMFFLRRLGASPVFAWCIAALFAVHPAHVATVQWIACQSELMVTTFLLSATLCYARYRGWAPDPEAAQAPLLAPATPPSAGGGGSSVWALACAVFYVLALGCRENAVMFPFVILALETLLLRGTRRRGFILVGLLAFLTMLYVAARTYYLGGAALPPKPYVIPPTDPGFLRYVFDKACYYLIGEFLAVPCIPIGGLPYFRAHPLAFYGMSIFVIVAFAVLALRFVRRRPGPIGPVWLVLFMAPVLPSFSSPHHLYLPGIGWAVCAMLIFRGIAGSGTMTLPRFTRPRLAFGWFALVFTGGVFGAATYFFGLSIETGARVEDRVAQEIIDAPSGLKDGDTIYIANQPILAHYVRLSIEQKTGLRNLHVVPLTWAPRVLGVATPTERTAWTGDCRTIDIRIAGDRYFSGPFGLLAAQNTGKALPVAPGEVVEGRGFKVQLLEHDDRGTQALRFTFDRPLTDPDLHLFWGSTTRWAKDITPGTLQ